MSYSGKLTPLALTAMSELLKNSGLQISGPAKDFQGTWDPDAGYVQGTVTLSTVLNKLTDSIPRYYQAVKDNFLTVEVYRKLITIGRPVDDTTVNCPALGNCRPDTFKTSYAGFGTWENSSVDKYFNRTSGVTYSKVEDNYPPRNYPNSGDYSYVYKEWGSTDPGPYTQKYQWDYPYSWVTAWPGKNEWQRTDDTYAAAYYPRPDLRPEDADLTDYDAYFSQGFIATVARQAYYEFWSDYETRRPNQYKEFSRAFRLCYEFSQSQNAMIGTYANSTTYASGSYSNINDITSNDVSGVSLAFKIFGNDLIRIGKCLDLSQLDKFGLPSLLLLTLQNYNALTEAVRLALLYNDLSTDTLNQILGGAQIATVQQEKRIYDSLQLIAGNDLNDICVLMNCTTAGLTTLADLVDPKKMFPDSYRTLTVPIYNVQTEQSKYYDFIYTNNGVNNRLGAYGEWLEGILPQDIMTACGAFSTSMRQINNISNMTCEKFAQVVANLEVVGKGLDLIGGVAGSPIDPALVNETTAQLSLGSGNRGTYRQCDFFGAMSGYPYRNYYEQAQSIIKKLPTSNLATIYTDIYNLSQSISVDVTSDLLTLINQANTEIKNICAVWSDLTQELNNYWNMIGNQLFIEQRSIPFVAPVSSQFYESAGQADLDTFVRSFEDFALNTRFCEASPVLEAICDTSVLGGQAIVGNLRESRNAARLMNSVGQLENDIPNELATQMASAEICELDTNGGVASITVTFGGYGYDAASPPQVIVGPYGGIFGGSGFGATAQAVISDGMVTEILVLTSGQDYDISSGCLQVYIDPPPSPERLGKAVVAGSFAGSEFTDQDPIPDNLVAPATASYDVAEAIDQVTTCNCDCWNM